MSRYVFYLLFALLLALSIGCASVGEKAKTPFSQEFSLRIGQSEQIGDAELEIKFEKVTEDSRCPKGATCIWAGQVSCEVLITDKKYSSYLTLTEPGLPNFPNQTIYKSYRLVYHVQPYPELSKKISAEEYRLVLIIEKLQ